MEKKSVLFICGHGDTLINFRKEFIECFINLEYKVYAIAPEISKLQLRELKFMGVEYIEINFKRKGVNPFDLLKSIFFVFKEIKKINPALVFSYTHKSVLIGSLASYFSGIDEVYSMITGRGHIFDQENIYKKIRRFFGILSFKIALKNNKKVFFQNPDDIELFLENKALKKEQVFMVNGSGVNLDYFKQQNLPEGLNFLCAARLLKSKGLLEFAEAFKIFNDEFPDAKAYIAGAPDDHDDSVPINEIKHKWKNKYGVEYLGHFDDIREAIKLCSVFVLLSYNEGTPRSVLEAMAMGRPILTTDVSGCKETVIDGKNGFLAKVKDPISASDLMKNFLKKETRISLGNQSRSMCEVKYDVNKVNKILLQQMNIY